MSDQQSSDQHTRDGQVQRAKRLREQIETLKSGRPSQPLPGHAKSLREQIEERRQRSQRPSSRRTRPVSRVLKARQPLLRASWLDGEETSSLQLSVSI